MPRRSGRSLTLAALLLACAALPAEALTWATRAACSTDDPAIAAEIFAPMSLAEVRAEAAQAPAHLGKFWRIESPDGAVSHLWGTIHSNDPVFLRLPDVVMNALNGASVVVQEVDFTTQTRAEMIEANQPSGLYRSRQEQTVSFADAGLPAPIRRAIEDRLFGLGWGADATRYLTLPTIAEVLLFAPCNDFRAGVMPLQDHLIHTIGKINGVEVVGIEAPDRISAHLKAPGNSDLAVAMLAVYGGSLVEDGFGARASAGAAFYLRGEIVLWQIADRQRTRRLMGEDTGGDMHALLADWLLIERNRDFVAATLPRLEAGGAFIAVGASHLPGEGGMVSLYRAAGYTVTRVPLPGEVTR